VLELLLLRHAKTERVADVGGDRERALTKRGRRDAALLGRFLAAADLAPDAVLTSPATRARETAELVIEAGGWRCPLREVASLYESSTANALAMVRAHGGDATTLLVVGHEPTWSELASALAGGGNLRLPTAGLAQIAFALDDWRAIEPGAGVLRLLVSPGALGGGAD
jgi:phosphohistidine phosphatase